MANLGDKVNPHGDEDKYKGLPQDTPPPILVNSLVSREEHLASLDSLKPSMRLEMAAMFEQYLGKKPSGPTDPSTAPIMDLSLAKVKPSNNVSTSMENIGDIPKENDDARRGASIPPLDKYPTPHVHYPMPNINNIRTPTKLDSRNFTKWQGLMKYHISSSSTHLWRVIQSGFAPHDPLSLSAREEVEEKLNVTAKHLIQQTMLETHSAHINTLSTAK
jgi:hypothetical protein